MLSIYLSSAKSLVRLVREGGIQSKSPLPTQGHHVLPAALSLHNEVVWQQMNEASPLLPAHHITKETRGPRK